MVSEMKADPSPIPISLQPNSIDGQQPGGIPPELVPFKQDNVMGDDFNNDKDGDGDNDNDGNQMDLQ